MFAQRFSRLLHNPCSTLSGLCKMRNNSLNSLMSIPGTQLRRLNIHEYQSMSLFQKFDVKVPNYTVATTAEEAEAQSEEMVSQGANDFVVKAQVHAGGRGKGKWDTGFVGGVHVGASPLEARSLAAKMLGNNLITKQSGAEGKPCDSVMICERIYLRRETYFAILMDRETSGPCLVGSSEGGMDIEAVAEATPELIHKIPCSLDEGPSDDQLYQLATNMGFNTDSTKDQAVANMKKLYDLFIESDCTLVEINPMAETHDGRVLCCDGKLNFDDNALYRQPEILAFRDTRQDDPREIFAEKVGLNYIGLDGSIGCLVNGAGLAMATMDAIKLFGGEPANFLDMGGGATHDMVTEAFRLLDKDKSVKAILVNIFGGIMRCDVIALGLINAATELGMKKPIIIRLAGTNVEEAQQIIEDSGLRMLTADNLEEAAIKAARVVDIVHLAERAQLDVSFEVPL